MDLIAKKPLNPVIKDSCKTVSQSEFPENISKFLGNRGY